MELPPLTQDAWIVVGLVGATVLLLVAQVLAIEVVCLGLVAALALTGVLTVPEALGGFSSPATLTVAAMLVLSAGLERTGVVDYLSRHLARLGGGRERRVLLVLLLPTAALSAFMNNTPVVALMIPVALTLGRRGAIPGSKLLIPVSFASILGGTCTLIGTSTNILVDSLYRQAGGPGFGMFEFGGLGLVYLLVGLTYVLLLGPRLLPRRAALNELLSAAAPAHFVTEVVLGPESKLVGRTLGEAFDPSREIRVLEVVRGEEALLRPAAGLVLAEGDALLVQSEARELHSLLSSKGVEHGSAVADDQRVSIQRVDLRVAEAVVTPNSRFIGHLIRGLGLSRDFDVQVLAVRRLGRRHHRQVRRWRLRAGDVLLVQGEPRALRRLQEGGDVLLVEGVEQALTFPRRAPIAVAVMAAVVLLASLDLAPIVLLALGGVALMFATRCLDAREALRALDPSVLLLLAGTIPLGRAMESTGLAGHVAHWVVELAGEHGPWVLIAAVYLLTSALTEVVSNNATAVLLTPIALSAATQLGVDPKPLLVALAFGGSASFATPIGYQTNTLVMGPGGYLFRDFLRFGLPMNVLLAAVAATLIPVFWPP